MAAATNYLEEQQQQQQQRERRCQRLQHLQLHKITAAGVVFGLLLAAAAICVNGVSFVCIS